MKLNENHSLEQMLESAIVASWEDLSHGVEPELIHIEYNFATGGTLDDLSIWSSSARGHWLLLCEYWMSASHCHSSGLHFENGYHSERLARTLEIVMQDQKMFALPKDFDRPGLIQISRPTEAEIAAAGASVRAICDHSSAAHEQPALT